MCGVLPCMWKGFTRLQFVAWSVESCQSELCRVCCVLLSSFYLIKKFSLSPCIVVYVSSYPRNRVLARAGISQSGLDYVCHVKFCRVCERTLLRVEGPKAASQNLVVFVSSAVYVKGFRAIVKLSREASKAASQNFVAFVVCVEFCCVCRTKNSFFLLSLIYLSIESSLSFYL